MAKGATPTFDKVKVVADNRRAYFEYFVEEKFEAGIALVGTEVKSLRGGEGSIAESYATVDGEEVFLINANIPLYKNSGYVTHEPRRPRRLLLKRREINKLTGANYSHEFYVDGPPVVADVFNGTEWRTILVGTLKAGGKSIFALDVTTPGEEELLWEFNDSDLPDDAEARMGYSFSQPTIARLHTGTWAVVFGNGYESANNTNGKTARQSD